MKNFFIFVAIIAGLLIGALSHRFSTETVLLRGNGGREIAVILRTDSLTGKVAWTYVGSGEALEGSFGDWISPTSWSDNIKPYAPNTPEISTNKVLDIQPVQPKTFLPDEVSPPKTPDFKTLHRETNAVDQH
jgi:hypothetical protein